MTPQNRGLGHGLGALIPSAEQAPASMVLVVAISSITPNPRQPRTKMATGQAGRAGGVHPRAWRDPTADRDTHARRRARVLSTDRRRTTLARGATRRAGPGASPGQRSHVATTPRVGPGRKRPPRRPQHAGRGRSLPRPDPGIRLEPGGCRRHVGKSRVAVANAVRLLRLPAPVALLAEGSLSEGHARALLALSDDETLIRATQQVVARDLTVRQTEELPAGWPPSRRPKPQRPISNRTRRPTPIPKAWKKPSRAALGTKVALTRGRAAAASSSLSTPTKNSRPSTTISSHTRINHE